MDDHRAGSPRIYALSVHEGYACRHSGECCTAGWAIPVEPAIRPLLRVELVEPAADGRCEWHDRSQLRCRIHRDHGEGWLPRSCYHFPRRALRDDRGIFVTLSHFCPTAAEQLFRQGPPLRIVEAPDGFPEAREYDGLDGRDAWPPLVRPGLMFDLQSYSRWERFLVERLAVENREITDTLSAIAAAAERLRRWQPANAPLDVWMDRILSHPGETNDRDLLRDLYAPYADSASFTRIANAVPAGLAVPPRPADLDRVIESVITPAWSRWRTPVCAYLAAKAFGSWCAYQAYGVRTAVAELVAAEMVLRAEAARLCAAAGRPLDRELMLATIRAADWLLVHLADRAILTAWFGEVERA